MGFIGKTVNETAITLDYVCDSNDINLGGSMSFYPTEYAKDQTGSLWQCGYGDIDEDGEEVWHPHSNMFAGDEERIEEYNQSIF